MKDYYAILGVSPDANEGAIKNRYRELVKQYHPDIHKDNPEAAKKMAEINEAYETLSDTEKRQRYDLLKKGGVTGPDFSVADFSGFDFSEGLGGLFEDFFDIFRGGKTATKTRVAYQRGADIELQIEISLKDVLTGVKKQITLDRLETCETCKGKGTRSGTERATCSTCNGTGYAKSETRTPFGVMIRTTTCSKCGGEGRIIKDPCPTCKGSGTAYKHRQVTVEIPAGIEDGMRVRLGEEGHQGKLGGPKGDLFVRVRVRKDPYLARQGKNLFYQLKIPYYTAILGGQVEVPTLDGMKALSLHKGTQHQENYSLKGLGLPGVNDLRRGDFKVVVEVEIPRDLNPEEEKLLREISRKKEQSKGPWWKS